MRKRKESEDLLEDLEVNERDRCFDGVAAGVDEGSENGGYRAVGVMAVVLKAAAAGRGGTERR